jgi:cytochrome d ubiquinol oxidase subunit II
MHLQDLWFIAIAVLWTGYFFLEGFDFGVGMLLPVLGRAEDERRALISTIGPVWDGNEVWLIVAAGATSRRFHCGTPRCSPASTSRCWLSSSR